MATVIRNPVLLHYLQQFGVTPAQMREQDASKSVPAVDYPLAELMDYLANNLGTPATADPRDR